MLFLGLLMEASCLRMLPSMFQRPLAVGDGETGPVDSAANEVHTHTQIGGAGQGSGRELRAGVGGLVWPG